MSSFTQDLQSHSVSVTTKITEEFYHLKSHFQESLQEWVRREIIDDDPYDVATCFPKTSEELNGTACSISE